MLPQGFGIKVREKGDGTWGWEIRRFGKPVADGSAPNKKKAELRLKKKLAEVLVDSTKRHAGKAEYRLKLRYWMERRVYVLSHVLYALREGRSRADVVGSAVDEEVELHRRDKKKGIALPLPTHHLSKPADEVAGVIYDCCMQLGLTGEKAFRWGEKMLGMAFSNPEAESHIVVERAHREKDPEVDDIDPNASDLEG